MKGRIIYWGLVILPGGGRGGTGWGEGRESFFYFSSIASVEASCFVRLCTAANGSAQSDANKKSDILRKQQKPINDACGEISAKCFTE